MPDTTLTKHELIPIGAITEVHGPVVVIACDQLPSLRQALCAHLDHETYLFEVHQYLDEQHIRAITLHRPAGLRRGMPVYDTGAPLHVPVSADCLGRLLNIFGEPLDGGEPLPEKAFRNIHARPVPVHGELPVTRRLRPESLLDSAFCGRTSGLQGGRSVNLC